MARSRFFLFMEGCAKMCQRPRINSANSGPLKISQEEKKKGSSDAVRKYVGRYSREFQNERRKRSAVYIE